MTSEDEGGRETTAAPTDRHAGDGVPPVDGPPSVGSRSGRRLRAGLAGGNPLPEGTLAVGGGLVVLGVATYLFFALAGRALGPERYAAFAVLWTLVFFAAPGVMFPIEQEVGRAVSARRAVGLGGGPVIRRAAVLGGGLTAVLVVGTLAASGFILDRLFDGEVLLLVGLVIALPAYAAAHLLRGTLSGSGRFRPYAWLLVTEGLSRVVAGLVLVVLSVRIAGAYGLLVGLAPLAAVLVIVSRQRRLAPDGPEARWSELSGALGWLLAGSVLAQGFVNAPVPIIKVLSGPGEEEIAGVFQAGLIIARVPLFLFQAVQASLLPKLAGLVAAGRLTDFRTGLQRLIVVVAAIGVAATIGGFTVGPLALRLAFGPRFAQLDHLDIGLLALASAAFMLAMALAQALIAANGHAKAAGGWFVAVVVLAVVTWLGDDLLLRVELGLVVGSIVAVAAMGLLLRAHLATHRAPESAEGLLEAMAPTHEIIEP